MRNAGPGREEERTFIVGGREGGVRPGRRASHSRRRMWASLRSSRLPASLRAATAPQSPPRARTSAARAAATPPAVAAVLFDMDGVLTLSENLSRAVAAVMMRERYGVAVDPAEYVKFVGQGEAVFLGGVAASHGVTASVDELKAAFFAAYEVACADPGTDIAGPGARDLVRACRAAGLRVAVASSADLVKVRMNLAAAGFDLENDFDAVVTADEFEKLKPAPDIFLAAAAILSTPACACVVIEDAPAGIEAARAAGMRVLGVCTTLREDEMRALTPDDVAKDTSEVTVERLLALMDVRTTAA